MFSLALAGLSFFGAVVFALWPHIKNLVLRSNLYNLPGPPRVSFWKGNLGQLFDQKGWEWHDKIVKKYGGAVKLQGLCGDEQVYVSDPKALYHIVVKDQDIYEETKYFIVSNLVCFGPGMVSVVGEQHRRQRKLLNPVFNINHIRGLTPLFYRITHDLVRVLKELVKEADAPSREIDMAYWTKRTALEFIGQGGLGYSFGSLNDASTNEYSVSVRNLAPTLFRLSILRQFLPTLHKIGTPRLQRWVVAHTPIKRVQRLYKIVEVMTRTSEAVFEEKKRALALGDEAVEQQVGEGRDIISILLKENTKASKEDRLPDEELLGQMTTLVFAAQDTTSAALARVLHMLATHPDRQARLRREIHDARALAHGDVPYEELHALPYLDAVCRETLRLYPPIFMLHRTTRHAATLPLSQPILAADGKTHLHALPLRANQNVIIAIHAANRRTDMWGPDAGAWVPERWLVPLPESVAAAHLPCVYSSMMTFLGGGRSCIGFKFAQLEMKVVISLLVAHFHFSLADVKYAWKLGGIVSPGIESDPVPKLPLRVSLVN